MEVQVDALRDQIDQLQQEMQKLYEAIADHEVQKRSKDGLSEPGRRPELPKR